MNRLAVSWLLLLLLSAAPAGSASAAPAKSDSSSAKRGGEEPPVVTRHQMAVNGRTLKYTVTTGLMPIRNPDGEVEAEMFYMAYTLDGAAPRSRPLMFSFNGGPGSSSVWLHLGALGPKRVRMEPDGMMPSPPYRLVDNESTWLDLADLVFIDPVGTGYSRAVKPDLGKKFWSVRGDIQSVGEFIRLYLTRSRRWSSPLFLVGESYGTTRAAGLSGYLVDQGIAFNGILLVSSVLNFQTSRFNTGNDLPYPLFLPTYTATAWFHHRLPADLQSRPLSAVLAEAEAWAAAGYTDALAQGDRLSAEARRETIEKLRRYTGLGQDFFDQYDLRPEIQHFCKELLRDRRRTVGRLDARFTGIDPISGGETPDFDPSMAAIRPPYTAAFNDYVRGELGYSSDRTYYILGGGIQDWDFQSENSYTDVSAALRGAFARNPSMHLFIGSGYYDLATPYFATRYTVAHMGLEPEERARITMKDYEAGHMMYIHTGELAKLKRDVAQFIAGSLGGR